MDSQVESVLHSVDRDVIANLDGLESVHETIAEFWNAVNERECCQSDGTWQALFNSAIAEIAGNIVRHAYLDPESGEMFRITLQCFSNRVEAILLDHGAPFDFTMASRSPDMRDALENLDLDNGWGLPISYAAVDSLNYERLPDGHNRWHLTKRLV